MSESAQVILIISAVIFVLINVILWLFILNKRKKKRSGTIAETPVRSESPKEKAPERSASYEENIQIIPPRPAPEVDPKFVLEDNMISVGTDERIP